MSVAHGLIIDQLSPPVDGEQHLATWYTQGHSDGLGDRLLMFDNTSAPSWEILRFRPALARDPRFEAALRQRVEHLASFRHPAFPLVRPLKGLGHEDGLAVVSTFAPGLRLSEAMSRPRSVAFAVRLIRQLVPAIASLQQHGPNIFHGALDADRIVVTADGRLTIREHMIGAALASLEPSAAALWADFRVIAAPVSVAAPVFDSRTDVIQIGLVVLSLMAGRRVSPDEYPARVEGLLDDIAQRNGRRALVAFQSLRYWIERALQLDDYMFESALDANEALADLRDDTDEREDYRASISATAHDASDAGVSLEPAGERPDMNATPRAVVGRSSFEESDDSPASGAAVIHDVSADDVDRSPAAHDIVAPPARRFGRAVYWSAAFVAAVAIGEAVFIGRLLYARAAIPPPIPAPKTIESAWTRPSPAPPVAPLSSERLDAAPADVKVVTTKVNTATAVPAVASGSQRNGGIRLVAPFEVHVLDNERLLGSSTEGPIVAPAGQHEFEFVNSVIGYRVRRVVDIKPGQITAMTVPLPNGTLNINAVPWAAVWIDGNSFGDTPLGNLSIPAGEHEIVFRHPQLGERREKTLVRVDSPTRVTVNLER
jgi:PEGA domain-containing protein